MLLHLRGAMFFAVMLLGVTGDSGHAQTIVVPPAPPPPAAPIPFPAAPPSTSPTVRPDLTPRLDPRCSQLTEAQRRVTPGCK